jgi:hypothetical protein
MSNRWSNPLSFAIALVFLASCAATSTPDYAEILTNANRPEAE